MTFDFLDTVVEATTRPIALAKPPTWTRLEPQSYSGDPRPGLEARVHDPLWFLGRQWQLGEFEGEDAGSPLTVRVVTRSVPVDRWAAGTGGGPSLALGGHDLLEPLVEAEPLPDPLGPGVRARAESGSALLAAFEDGGFADPAQYKDAVVAACPLDLDPLHHPDGAHASLDPAFVRLSRLLAGRPVADAESAAAALEAARPDLPPWLAPADPGERAGLLTLTSTWLAWYRSEVSPPVGGADAWVGDRLEYRFRVGAGSSVLAAPAHGGGEIAWHSFDATESDLPQPDDGPAPADPEPEVHALLASPLRYPGMPADRLWEMEDAQVNLGLVEAEPWDLARLLLAEFALTYGNDWLVVPVDVSVGSLTTVESVLFVTTFGEHYHVLPTREVSPDGHWRMYAITTTAGESADGLLVPPGAVAVNDGPPVEEVLFLRDEMANLAWAVERNVTGPSGTARDRSRERDGFNVPDPGPVEQAELDYLLQTAVPGRWIPYLPRTSGYRAIELVQGAMPDIEGNAVAPLGKLLNAPETKVLKDAEVPREGIVVKRQPSMTRRADGTYVRWTTRRVGVGRGEGASQLAFDWARSRKPKPND